MEHQIFWKIKHYTYIKNFKVSFSSLNIISIHFGILMMKLSFTIRKIESKQWFVLFQNSMPALYKSSSITARKIMSILINFLIQTFRTMEWKFPGPLQTKQSSAVLSAIPLWQTILNSALKHKFSFTPSTPLECCSIPSSLAPFIVCFIFISTLASPATNHTHSNEMQGTGYSSVGYSLELIRLQLWYGVKSPKSKGFCLGKVLIPAQFNSISLEWFWTNVHTSIWLQIIGIGYRKYNPSSCPF